jgi:hypothetical protein
MRSFRFQLARLKLTIVIFPAAGVLRTTRPKWCQSGFGHPFFDADLDVIARIDAVVCEL